jgi:hypothetical protein
MSQISLRFPNSSSGGEPPRFSIDSETREQIRTLVGSSLDDDQFVALISEIEQVVAKYLYLVGAAISAPILNRRKEEFSALRRELADVRHRLEKLQDGDVGDFYTAYIEHSLSHPRLDEDPLGKLIKFFDYTREYGTLVRAVEKACEAGLRQALASAQAGLQPMRIWDIWIRETASIWHRYHLRVKVRNDDLGVSSFVRLIIILQSTFDLPFQQHTKNSSALSQAVSRALGEGRMLA